MSSEDVNKIKVEKVYDEYIKMDVYKLPLLQATYCPKMNDLRRLWHCVGCEHKLGYVESHRETYCIYPNIKENRQKTMNDEDKKHETITIGYEEILNRVFFELPYIIEELQVKLNEAKDGLTILCAQYALVEEKMKIFEGMSQSFIVPKDELEDFEDKLKKSRDLIWKNLLEDYKINKEKEATKK